jgi:hypothetical protein
MKRMLVREIIDDIELSEEQREINRFEKEN